MAVIYTATALMGAQSFGLYAERLSDPDFIGSDAFAIIAHHYFGRGGGLLLAVTVTLCCMKTAVGLVASCAEIFEEMFQAGDTAGCCAFADMPARTAVRQ